MNKIKHYRQLKGLNQSDLAKLVGVSRSAVSMWEINKSQPDTDILSRLSEILSVSVDKLLGIDRPSPKPYDYIIPVLGRVEAGIPYTAIQEIIDEEQLSPDTDMRFDYVGLQIHGASMEPRMKEGDVVIVRIQEDVDDGDIAVVFVNGDEATIKKIKKTPSGISLIPLNPAFEPLFFSNEEIESLPVRIFGKVVELRAKF